MKNTAAVDTSLLLYVTGGDSGDAVYECKNHVQLYNVGDYVEIYHTVLHIHTFRARIVQVKVWEDMCGFNMFDRYDVIHYFVKKDDADCGTWVTADRIQRP